jgi:putative colanic acid biosynthesis UDP-glucose lipid carrier transferase
MLYKFRTMKRETSAYMLKPDKDDVRITRIGRFLRNTGLDEVPQLFNVLKGEMSLVGPRPEMPFIVEGYQKGERERLKVKPGITGLWQLSGRTNMPIHCNLEYDLAYIKDRSLSLDLKILFETLKWFLRNKAGICSKFFRNVRNRLFRKD